MSLTFSHESRAYPPLPYLSATPHCTLWASPEVWDLGREVKGLGTEPVSKCSLAPSETSFLLKLVYFRRSCKTTRDKK